MARKDIELAIRIAGEIDKSLGYSVDMTNKELNRLAAQAAIAQRKTEADIADFDKWGQRVSGITKTAVNAGKLIIGVGTAGAAAIGAIGAAALKAGTDFEDAFTGVRKTVEATEEEFDVIEQKLRNMAKNKPQTVVEIAGVAEIAGQSGIEVSAIPDFTGVMVDLSSATDLPQAEGAEQIAQYANITRMDQRDFDRLGATLVDLGNKLPATESKIMEMATRVAATGAQLGMSDAEILGYSGALASVGLEAQGGGTGFSRTAIEIQSAVETGSEALADFAAVAGMTREAYAELFREDPSEALYQFIAGLNNVERNGKSALGVLADLDINEIRQRDALLRLANASDIVRASLDNADTAWDENIALTKEAEQRYRTFNSRLQMTKNRINDVGISLYQDFQEPLSDLMGVALDASEDLDIFDDEFIKDMADAATEYIPTAVRECKELRNAVGDFAGPLVSTAINNMDLIGSGIAGIGAALITANAAKGIGQIVKEGGKLKTFMVGLPSALKGGSGVLGMVSSWGTLASLAVGGITAVNLAYKAYRKEVVDGKLDEAFGDIVLSMDELKDMADQIVTGGRITEMNRQLEELSNLESIADSVDSSADEIEKAFWKIRQGYELTQVDSEDLESNITDIVNDAVAAVEQAQYTAELNIDLLFGAGNEEGDRLKESLSTLYVSAHNEVSDLGTDLSEAFNEAMLDGILTEDEAAAIYEKAAAIRQKVAELSGYEQDARMQRLINETAVDLTPESFQNLLSVGREALEEGKEAYGSSYDALIASINQQHDQGLLSDNAYQKYYDTYTRQYEAQMLELQRNYLGYGADTLYQALDLNDIEINENQVSAFMDYLEQRIDSGNFRLSDMGGDLARQFFGMDDQDTKDALSEYWGEMEDAYKEFANELSSMVSSGEAIDSDVWADFIKMSIVGAWAGSEEAMLNIIGGELAENSELSSMLAESYESLGEEVPAWIAQGILNGSGEAEDSVANLFDLIDRLAREEAAAGVDVDYEVRVNPNFRITKILKADGSIFTYYKYQGSETSEDIEKHAMGGIMTSPHIGMVAEDGPEAIIPLDGSERAKSLWERAGELLGLFGDNGMSFSHSGYSESNEDTENFVINLNPTLNFNGNTSREDVVSATEEAYRVFESNMARFLKDRRRLAF